MKTQLRRRQFLGASAALAIASLSHGGDSGTPHVATNTYPWLTFARRNDREFHLHSEELLADIATTGISGYEPIINSAGEFDGLGARLTKHGLEMRSIYVNSVLHDRAKSAASMESVIEIAKSAAELGTHTVVTNPSPIRWGGPEDKSDDQLRWQAGALDELGSELKGLGVALAYHNHDAELRRGGREFHHMLTGTDPANVKFCLDAHWVFRGCGDSEVAVFDALAHYGERVVELHLRQSVDGVWTEAFSLDGDIDYRRLMDELAEIGIRPHLVLEQAVESQSTSELSDVEAHRKSFGAMQKAFS